MTMVETTSVREERPKLSAKDRLCLIQTINALPPTQFDELVFALDPPKGVVASSAAAQGTRSKGLLDWLEGSSGPGLTAADEILQVLIPKATKTAPQPMAFAISGRMGDLTPSELEAIAELLRQKTGDTSIALAFSREGSIKLILNGSSEGLAKLQELFEAGELETLDIPPIESLILVDSSSSDARKTRLIQAVKLSCQQLISKLNSFHDFARAIDLASDLNILLTLASANVRDLVIILNHYSNSRNDSQRDSDLAAASARYLARDLTKYLDNSSNIAREIDLNRDLDKALDSAATLANDLDSALELAITLTNASARYLTLARDLDSAHDLISDLESASNLARDLTHYIPCTSNIDPNLSSDLSGADLSGADLSGADLSGADLSGADLSGADLSRANLRYISMIRVDLTETDLTYADVTGTIFGDNPGLAEADKRNLQRCGAIILDPPSSDVPALALR